MDRFTSNSFFAWFPFRKRQGGLQTLYWFRNVLPITRSESSSLVSCLPAELDFAGSCPLFAESNSQVWRSFFLIKIKISRKSVNPNTKKNSFSLFFRGPDVLDSKFKWHSSLKKLHSYKEKNVGDKMPRVREGFTQVIEVSVPTLCRRHPIGQPRPTVWNPRTPIG